MTITGLLYFIKTFKYKQVDTDNLPEDLNLVHARNLPTRPSISTQTSIVGINNDNLSTTTSSEQEANKRN